MTTNNSEPDYKYILFDSPEAKRKQDKARAHIYDKNRIVPAYERDAKKFTPPKFRRGDILVLFAPLSVLSAKGFDGIIGSSVGSPADNSSSANDTRQCSDIYVAISNLKVASVSDPSTTLGEYLYTMETTGDSVGEAFFIAEQRTSNANLTTESSEPIWSCMGVRFVFKQQCSIVLHHVEIISTDDYRTIKKNSTRMAV